MPLVDLLPPSSAARLATIFLFSTLILQVLATSTTPNKSLFNRAETAGSSCDSEGQWNCMTNSFQRCASGQWSAEMNCAEGTVCSPSGKTDVFKVDYKDGQNGNQAPSDGGSSLGIKGSLNRRVVEVVVGLWVVLGLVC
ncbi:Fc.00g064340.m01.CDS01 [Cosmosporella sp. VM-42]